MNIANNNQNQKELIQMENELVLLVILVIAMYIHTSLLSERLVLAVTQLQLVKVKPFNDNYLQNACTCGTMQGVAELSGVTAGAQENLSNSPLVELRFESLNNMKCKF